MADASSAPKKTGLARDPLGQTRHSRYQALVHKRLAGQRGRRLRQLAARSKAASGERG